MRKVAEGCGRLWEVAASCGMLRDFQTNGILLKTNHLDPKYGKEIKRVSVFSWFLKYSFKLLGGFNYSKMANLGTRTYSNTFWIIFGTSKNVTKSRPPRPLFITRILQNIQENMDTFYTNISFVNLGSDMFTWFRKMRVSTILEMENTQWKYKERQ